MSLWPRLARAVVAALALGACVPETEPVARFWAGQQFLEGQARGATFAGFDTRLLVVPGGGTIPFLGGTQGAEPGLVVWPGFAEGQTASFLITDLWENHPPPWVQPVFTLVTNLEAATPLPLQLGLFAVDIDSTFYSPFWRQALVEVPADRAPDFTTARQVLAEPGRRRKGLGVLCPIIPAGLTVARPTGQERVTRPYSGEQFNGPQVRENWVEGRQVLYLTGGADTFQATADELVLDAPAYFFTRAGALLPLPPVLPDAPFGHSLWRRYDVPLPGSAAVFAPADAAPLRELLASQGLPTADADPAIPAEVARAYALRVALNAGCFADAARFPSGCTWLDSAGQVARLLGTRAVRTEVLVTGLTVQQGSRNRYGP